MSTSNGLLYRGGESSCCAFVSFTADAEVQGQEVVPVLKPARAESSVTPDRGAGRPWSCRVRERARESEKRLRFIFVRFLAAMFPTRNPH